MEEEDLAEIVTYILMIHPHEGKGHVPVTNISLLSVSKFSITHSGSSEAMMKIQREKLRLNKSIDLRKKSTSTIVPSKT